MLPKLLFLAEADRAHGPRPLGMGPSVLGYQPLPLAGPYYQLVGTTKNEDDGTVISGVTVKLFETGTDLCVAGPELSDANGNFAFLSSKYPLMKYNKQFYCVGYLAGSPDTAGTTINTLTVIGGRT